MDWANQCAERYKPALFCSLELSEIDLYARLTTLKHEKPWIEVRQGKHRDLLVSTIQDAVNSPLYGITRNELTCVDLLPSYIDELSQKYGTAPLVVIDYLQLLMPMGESREQWAVMADISAKVAHCAQDTGAPIICITAVNRQSYNTLDKTTGKPDKYMALAAAKRS